MEENVQAFGEMEGMLEQIQLENNQLEEKVKDLQEQLQD